MAPSAQLFGKSRALFAAFGLAACLGAGCDDTDKRLVALSNEGVQALEVSDFSRAKEIFQKAVEIAPNDADSRYYLGVIALRDDDAKAAIDHLLIAVKSDPARPDGHLSLAKALYTARQHKLAVQALQALFEIDPGHPNGHLLAARIALEASDRVTADRALRAAIAGDAAFAPAYLMLSRLYTDAGAYDAARDVLLEGLRLVPDAVELQEALGLAWLDLGRPDRARPVLEGATRHPRARHHLYLNYAAALLQLGEKEPAIQALRTFLLQAHGRGEDPAVAVAAKMLLRLRGR